LALVAVRSLVREMVEVYIACLLESKASPDYSSAYARTAL
jgi:hypothetical protein